MRVILFIILSACHAFAAAPAVWIGGKIVFYAETVDGNGVTEKERDSMSAARKREGRPGKIERVAPSPAQVNVSTCAILKNIDEYRSAFTKEGAKRQIVKLKKELDGLSDFPNDAETLDFRRRYDWFLSFYNSLP